MAVLVHVTRDNGWPGLQSGTLGVLCPGKLKCLGFCQTSPTERKRHQPRRDS